MPIYGAVPKWSKGTVCKTVIRGFESRPHLPFLASKFQAWFHLGFISTIL